MPSFMLIHPFGHNTPTSQTKQTGQTQQSVAWAETYLHAKWHLDPSSSLATIDTAENWGLCSHFKEGELGPQS